MHYLSDYLPEAIFKQMFYGDESKIKKNNSQKELSQFRNFSDIELNKISAPKIEFRNSSSIKLEKKPCPCMANKVKQTPSS